MESGVNQPEEQPNEIIIESMIGFDHVKFKDMIRIEAAYYGYDYELIGAKVYMRPRRMRILMSTKDLEFKYEEIKELNKLFNFY